MNNLSGPAVYPSASQRKFRYNPLIAYYYGVPSALLYDFILKFHPRYRRVPRRFLRKWFSFLKPKEWQEALNNLIQPPRPGLPVLVRMVDGSKIKDGRSFPLSKTCCQARRVCLDEFPENAPAWMAVVDLCEMGKYDAQRYGYTAACLRCILENQLNVRYDGGWYRWNRWFGEYPFFNSRKLDRAVKRLVEEGLMVARSNGDCTYWRAVYNEDGTPAKMIPVPPPPEYDDYGKLLPRPDSPTVELTPADTAMLKLYQVKTPEVALEWRKSIILKHSPSMLPKAAPTTPITFLPPPVSTPPPPVLLPDQVLHEGRVISVVTHPAGAPGRSSLN